MEEIKLKPEFESKLRELGVYEKWVENWKNDRFPTSIEFLNSIPDFEQFIQMSFVWDFTPEDEGFDFWDKISMSAIEPPKSQLQILIDENSKLKNELKELRIKEKEHIMNIGNFTLKQIIIAVLMAIVFFILMILTSCEKQPVQKIVKYEVLNTRGVICEYINEFGNTCIDSTEKSVYKALFEVNNKNEILFIKAKSKNEYNSIICRIYVDGKIVKQSTHYGIGETNCYFYLDFLD